MPTFWQVESLHARISSLEAEIRRVADKDHPYPEPDIIYRGLLAVMRQKLEHFNNVKGLWFPDGNAASGLGQHDNHIAQVLFDNLVKDLQRIAEVFSLADRVDSARIPFEILRSLSWVASSLLEENCRTVVRLDTVYNYSIASCRRKFEELGWGEMWIEATAKNKISPPLSTVLVLGFPSPDTGSILVHTLAAHEFGHEIAYKSLHHIRDIVFQAVVDIKQRYNDELKEYVADTVVLHEGISKDDAYEKSRKLVEARLLQLIDNWFQEIFADLFASRLVGPAFLAAFDRILLRFRRTESYASSRIP